MFTNRVANVPVHFEEIHVSGLISDTAAIDEAVSSIRRNGVGLKGVLKTKLDNVDHHSLNVTLR
jgi:isocitrate dehydrogenase (NAD+)